MARGFFTWPFGPWRSTRLVARPHGPGGNGGLDGRGVAKLKPEVAEWENEGGATSHNEPTVANAVESREEDFEGVLVRSDSLDVREDELMAVDSLDGRPPSRRLAAAEWKWLAVFVALVATGAAVWAVMDKMDATTMAAWGALMFIYGAAAAPVWGSLLFRKREQKDAHDEAVAERIKDWRH